MRIVVVGKNSFLGQALLNRTSVDSWCFLSHHEALSIVSYQDTTCVINFSLHPDIRKGLLTPETDFDSRIASLLKETGAHYVLISSRTVYGVSQDTKALREEDTPFPVTAYGKAKKQIEENVTQILGPDRVTILRLSNIFGFEIDEKRQSFFSTALSSLLRNNSIEYDVSPMVQRDFLSIERCVDALVQICNNRKAGIFNLGAGFGVEIGSIAAWLMEGFGDGRLIVTNSEFRDSFWLDMSKTNTAFDLPSVAESDLRKECIALGASLRSLARESFLFDPMPQSR